MDGLYFRVSTDRQTTENQFEDLLQVAEKDGSGRDWNSIRLHLSNCIQGEDFHNGRMIYRVQPEVVQALAKDCIYVEQGKSGRSGVRRRPLFEQMRRDASLRKFDRLLVWKVSRLGRDMRQVISTVYELADLGITVVPIKSQTGPISSTMGKLLWPSKLGSRRWKMGSGPRPFVPGKPEPEQREAHRKTTGDC
jgi:DNA invertase Pin-like site-specific DNA recombinase